MQTASLRGFHSGLVGIHGERGNVFFTLEPGRIVTDSTAVVEHPRGRPTERFDHRVIRLGVARMIGSDRFWILVQIEGLDAFIAFPVRADGVLAAAP